jgi:hypothetical protein
VTLPASKYCVAFNNKMSLLSPKDVTAKLVLYPLGKPKIPTRSALSWLGEIRGTATNWNLQGALIRSPSAPGTIDQVCSATARSAQTPEEYELAGAGWFLESGPSQRVGNIVLVSAMSGSGGMCRGSGHQTFVFVGGRLAGTLSPEPWEPRSDGAQTSVRILNGATLEADFDRYGGADPMCCPSRVTTVHYQIVNVGATPLVLALESKTRPK